MRDGSSPRRPSRDPAMTTPGLHNIWLLVVACILAWVVIGAMIGLAWLT